MGKKKKSEKPVKLFTLDTETRGLFGEVFRVGLYDGEKYSAANTFSTLKSIITRFAKEYDCHIFIHNLDFDLAKLAEDVIRETDLDHSIFINNNVAVYKTSLVETQIREECEIISQPITFHDSLKLISNMSLDKICKDFHIATEHAKMNLKDHILSLGWARDKYNRPTTNEKEYHKFNSEGYYFNHVHPEEKVLNDYLRNDCIGLYKVIEELIRMSQLDIHDFLKCPTTASLALKVYKKKYPEDYEMAVSTKIYFSKTEGKFYENFIREGYFGGRTEVFTPLLENGFHYDVNSLYPYIMKMNKFPVGKPNHYIGMQAEILFKDWLKRKKGAGFLEVDIYIPEDLFIPPLPRNDKLNPRYEKFKKLIFPVGKIHGVYTYEEIELALEMGGRIDKYYQSVHFNRTAYIFRNFVQYFEEIKKNSEGALRTFAKLMQNSLYGKFGMIRNRETMLPYSALEMCEEKGYLYRIAEHPLIKGQKFIIAIVPSHAEYIQPHIAAYVTSLARILLYRGLIAQLGKGAVHYCDTDSIACQELFDPDMVDDKEYGKWKLESEIKEGLFLQPKVYYEKHKAYLKNETGEFILDDNGNKIHKETKKFKGVPSKHISKLHRGTYFDIYERLKEIQRKTEAGEMISEEEEKYLLYEKDEKRVKFGTALKNGEKIKYNFDHKLEVRKCLILTSRQKRNMDYIRNTSKPHVVHDY